MELNLGLPLVHFDRVMSHEEVLWLVSQCQSYHVLLLGIFGSDVTFCSFQR